MMKKFLFIIGGLCAATAGFLVFGTKRVPPLDELAHQLETAWSDYHTVV